MVMDNATNSSEIPLLTFNSLYNILREEKTTEELRELPQGFFDALEIFFKNKKDELKKFESSNDLENLRKTKHTLKTSKKIVNELLFLRYNKLSSLSISDVIYGESSVSPDKLLEREFNFYDDIKNIVVKYNKEVIKNE